MFLEGSKRYIYGLEFTSKSKGLVSVSAYSQTAGVAVWVKHDNYHQSLPHSLVV